MSSAVCVYVMYIFNKHSNVFQEENSLSKKLWKQRGGGLNRQIGIHIIMDCRVVKLYGIMNDVKC